MPSVPVTASARLKKDYARLMRDPVPLCVAAPLHANILEWHYVVEGAPGTPYETGLYHGKLVFPPDFPFKPPAIYMLTPSGRFQTNTRLCLSISDFHPDTWNPAWTVSTILTGLLSFMNENSPTLGSIQTSDYEKKVFAKRSGEYNLRNRTFCDLFPDLAQRIRDDLERERQALAARSGGSNSAGDSSVASGNATGGAQLNSVDSMTYSLLVLVGVVALAFAVRYVLNAANDGDFAATDQPPI